jgi:hypothetical protein
MPLEREPMPGQVLRSRRHGINVEVKSVQYTGRITTLICRELET